jgi:dolichol-phosphate mannosyltransferase
VSGTQIMILGILGEYLWRALDAARSRPVFVVDRVLQGVSTNGSPRADAPDPEAVETQEVASD